MSENTLSSQRSVADTLPAECSEWPLGGITPFTTIDFPGRLAAVLYTQGCDWRCRYCHNSHLWPFRSDGALSFKKAVQFLEDRRGLLDGVVFSGGEPTAHEGLAQAMRFVKNMGYAVGLHTTGMRPERLKEVIASCDWVGMDVKAPFEGYEKITKVPQSGSAPRESARFLAQSGVAYEFRTTVHPDLLSEEEIWELAQGLAAMGATHYAIQTFHPKGCLDQELKSKPTSPRIISESLESRLQKLFPSFTVRS